MSSSVQEQVLYRASRGAGSGFARQIPHTLLQRSTSPAGEVKSVVRDQDFLYNFLSSIFAFSKILRRSEDRFFPARLM